LRRYTKGRGKEKRLGNEWKQNGSGLVKGGEGGGQNILNCI
jgi:hypothetical protein